MKPDMTSGYLQYEKQVFDWLMEQHQKNPDFRFSVRRKASKGSELKYFIGTEKSKYFATTFWPIQVNFPGSTSDLIDAVFYYPKDGEYKYAIEFTQTKKPYNDQNKSALALIQSIKENIKSKLGLSYESSSDAKMESYHTKPKKESYSDVASLLNDLKEDLDVLFPIVNEAIKKEIKNNPSFNAHPFTQSEFDENNQKLDSRLKKHSGLIIDKPVNSEADIINALKRTSRENAVSYFILVAKLIRELSIAENDERVSYSCRDNKRFALTIGQRYCLSLELNIKQVWGFILLKTIKASVDSFYIEFEGNPKAFYYNSDSLSDLEDNFSGIIEGSRKEYARSEKSSNLKYSSVPFQKAIFDLNYRQELFAKAFPKSESSELKHSLNTIFYGPPGTGKTYLTVLRAAEIIENRAITEYDEALEIFNTHLGDRIEFITFHQNYSYEDFIQGLRPDVDNGPELSFERKDGVFKRISDRALENLRLSEKAPLDITKELLFNSALQKFSEEILEKDEKYILNDTVYIFEVEADAYRYTGDQWTRHSHGLRMKFTDLRELYLQDVKTRQDIKKLKTISGLANQHATYYLLVYNKILKHIPSKIVTPSIKKVNYVIIIDEINRANISRVFGELITLIEKDKRSHGKIPLKCTLPSGKDFIVPSNLFIIGTMNTADKSIALLDIALRRRFDFEPMFPLYEIEGHEIYDTEILQKLNNQIKKLKGHDFQIGHSYFMGDNKDLIERMNKKVIPLLLEYFMNDEKEVKGILTGAGLAVEQDSWPLKIDGLL
jgi:hypothetical protein